MGGLAVVQGSVALAIFESTPGNSALLRPDFPVFTILGVTDDYIKTSGHSREQLVGKGLFEAFPNRPDDPESISEKGLRASLELVLTTKKLHQLPLHRYDVPDGNGGFDERWWSAVNKPVVGRDGEVEYIIHSAEDVTAAIKAERSADRIRDLERSYHFFMQAPVVIGIVIGSNYIIEMANDRLLEVWGRNPSVIGRPLFEAIPELQGQPFRELLDQVLQSAEPFQAFQHPIRLNRGAKEEVLYFDFVYKPYYQEGQAQPIGVLAVGHDVTKQVESRQKFKSVIHAASDPILILVGEDFVLDNANPAFFDLWQVNPEAIGKTFLDILPEMRGQVFYSWLLNVLHTGEPFYGREVPAVFKRRNGLEEIVYFDFSCKPYRDAQGTITGVLVMATDVSSKVLARKQIEESELRFRTLAEALPQMVWMRNVNGVIEYGSNHWEEYSGIKGVSQAWMEMVHPDDWKPVMEAWQRDSTEGRSYRYEVRLKNKEGEYRWHYATGEPIRNNEGTIIKWIGVLTDIHAQKTFAEKLEKEVAERTRELRNSESFLQQLIDSSVEYIVVVDKVLRVVTINRRAEELMHTRRSDLKNTSLFDFHPQLKDTDFHQAILKVLEGQHIHLNKVTSLAQPDQVIDTYIIPYIAEDEVQGAIVMARDITMIVQTESRLQQVVRELERSNEDLQQFAHVASHDLKEPVRKILTFGNRLKLELGKDISEKGSQYLSKIDGAAIRMYSMIDGVLLYSSLNALEQAKELIDLNELIEQVEADLELVIGEKNAVIDYDGLPQIKGSPILIYQLFYNLVNNSLKFSRSDQHPVIDISAHLAAEEERLSLCLSIKQSYIKITLRDNGIGFDPGDAEKIFQTFTRLNSKDKYEGTGLGLSLCRKIVERHGGIIYAEGEQDKGAKFHILLPMEL